MRADDGVADRQADTGPGTHRLGREERLEHARAQIARDARTVVADHQTELRLRGFVAGSECATGAVAARPFKACWALSTRLVTSWPSWSGSALKTGRSPAQIGRHLYPGRADAIGDEFERRTGPSGSRSTGFFSGPRCRAMARKLLTMRPQRSAAARCARHVGRARRCRPPRASTPGRRRSTAGC